MSVRGEEGMATPNGFGRRRGLLLLAGAACPGLAQAQETTPATTPSPPPQPVAPPVPPARPPVPSTAPYDRSKVYYLFFDQTIDVASMRALRHRLTDLVEAGVSEITIVISSTGGLLNPMLLTYSFIRSLPARINTHAQGYVMSAASALFLAGEQRTMDRNAWFMFHPSTFPVSGTLSEQQLHESLLQIDAVGAAVTQIYLDRTNFTQADIERFGREEVVYTAAQAREHGVVQTVADLRIPGDGKAKLLFLD